MAANLPGRQTAPAQRADPQRATASPAPRGAGPVRAGIARLQRTLGNTGISRLLHAGTIQAKLTVGPADDQYEREADRVADDVMRMPDPASAARAQHAAPAIQRKCVECDEEDEGILQADREDAARGGGTHIPAGFNAQMNQLARAGQPLREDTRSFYESRFDADFSAVRIHTGTAATELNQAISAKAFTHSNHIYFSDQAYDTSSREGKKLLAHELTHVVQQEGGTLGRARSLRRAGAEAVAPSETPEVSVSLLGVPKSLMRQKGGKPATKSAQAKGTYALHKGKGATAYQYILNSEDVLASTNPWEMVVRRHFRNIFPTAPAGAEQKVLDLITSRTFELNNAPADIKKIAKEAPTTDVTIETGLHRTLLDYMKDLYPAVPAVSPVEATYGLGEGAGKGAQAPPPAQPTTGEPVKGQAIHLPGNLKADEKATILKTLEEILVAPDPNQKPDKPPSDLVISLEGAQMLLQIAKDPALLARLKSAGVAKGGGPDFEQSLEIAIANEARARARAKLGLADPTGSRREDPIVNRPVHGEIKNLTGYLVPTQEARFVFEVLDDRDAFRVPMVSIQWFAYPKGEPRKLVDREVTNYIPVRSQGLINDKIFNVTFDKPGEYEIDALVEHNFFLPAAFKRSVRVVTETALAKELNKEELTGFAADEGTTKPYLYKIGGSQGLQMGTETRGKLDPKATILSIEDRLKTVADEEKLVRDLIANYKGQKTREAEGILKWATNYLETLEESKASLKKDKGGVPLGVRGVFISRETEFPTKSLTLLCYFFKTSDGYQLILRDFTQLYEPEDYRFEAKDKTVEKSEEKAFLKQADAYPFGTLSVTFQAFDETTHKAKDQFVRFEKVTDTPEKKIKKFLFGVTVDIAVNLLAAILMIIPGLQVLGIALAIAYNTAKTVAELEDAANKGTLTGRKVGVGLAQIALNVIPLAGRGAKLLTIAGKTFYVMEAVNVAGNILLVTAQGMGEVDKLRNGVIKELAAVDAKIRHLEGTNKADPSLPELKKRRTELIKQGEDATVKVFSELLAQQALMMVGQHLVIGYMSRKFSVGELKTQGVFRHEQNAPARYDFKDGVIVGDELRISPAELERFQVQHAQNKALDGVVADPVQRQKVVDAFGDRPVEVKTGAAKTALKQEGGKATLEVADGAKHADILSEAAKVKALPKPPPEPPAAPKKDKAEADKAAPEDTFKPVEPKKPAAVEKEPATKPLPDEKALEALGEAATSLEAQAKAAYAAAKKKGFQSKTAKAEQLTEQDFIDNYKNGEAFDPETSRFRVLDPAAKPPPEPFPAGTDTQMILDRLTGKQSTSTFKKYAEMLRKEKLADDAEIRAAVDDVRKKYNLDKEAASVDDVRHALKEKFRPKVVKSMFEAADGTKLDAKASHKKMLEVTKELNSADKGTLTEEWVQKTRKAAREAENLTEEVPQKVGVKKSDHQAMDKDRQLDRVEGDTINEIKSTDSYLSKDDKAEIADHLKLIGTKGATIDVRGTPRIVNKEKLTFTHPEGARKNADYVIEQLKASDVLSVEVFNAAGESRVFTKATVGDLLAFIGKK